jgi:hypothetical protein
MTAERDKFTATTVRERQLWCSVLQQVLDDCSIRLPKRPQDAVRQSREFLDKALYLWRKHNADVISAREFVLRRRNKWREVVCDFAGITEECFVKKARQIIEKAKAA